MWNKPNGASGDPPDDTIAGYAELAAVITSEAMARMIERASLAETPTEELLALAQTYALLAIAGELANTNVVVGELLLEREEEK